MDRILLPGLPMLVGIPVAKMFVVGPGSERRDAGISNAPLVKGALLLNRAILIGRGVTRALSRQSTDAWYHRQVRGQRRPVGKSGRAPLLGNEIFDTIVRSNREERVAVLQVEQNTVAALDVVSHADLNEQGRVVMSGSAANRRENPGIKKAYPRGGTARADEHAVKPHRRGKRWLA
jgi:hypothetical protein